MEKVKCSRCKQLVDKQDFASGRHACCRVKNPRFKFALAKIAADAHRQDARTMSEMSWASRGNVPASVRNEFILRAAS